MAVDLSNATQEVKDYVAQLEAKVAHASSASELADAKVDTVLMKIAGMKASWVIVLAWTVVSFVAGIFFAGKAHAAPVHWGNPSAYASATGGAGGSGGGGDTHAIGLGSGSPSANACQGTFLFGFSYTAESCARQEWLRALGTHPTHMQLQIACQDALLRDLPMCKGYAQPRPAGSSASNQPPY